MFENKLENNTSLAQENTVENAVVLDFSGAVCKADIFEELSKKMTWENWYGRNLDALWDVLTGMPVTGDFYRIILPPEERTINSYASAVAEIFKEAGKTVIEI